MYKKDAGLLVRAGNVADICARWLSDHSLLVVFILGIILAIIVYAANHKSEHAEIYGRIIKVITSAVGAISALTLLLPFVARALWGTSDNIQPAPPECLSLIPSTCNINLTQYLELKSHNTVPFSTLLGVAVLILFLAATVWFLGALRDALKRKSPGRPSAP